MTLGQDLGLVLPTFAHAVVSRAFQQALVVARVGLAEGIVFEAENPHHALRFLLQSWSERGREERGSTGKWLSACFLLLARVWGTGLILSPAPPLNSSPLGWDVRLSFTSQRWKSVSEWLPLRGRLFLLIFCPRRM